MAAEEFTLICFDIADNRRRRSVVAELESWGSRAQESVFECWLGSADRTKLASRLEKLIDPGEDRVGIYALSAADVRDIHSYGKGLPAENFRHAIL